MLVEVGKRCSLTKSVLAGWARRGTPRQAGFLLPCLRAEAASRDASKRASPLRRRALPAPKTFDGYDWGIASWPGGGSGATTCCRCRSCAAGRAWS
jgi:hypothetical protein